MPGGLNEYSRSLRAALFPSTKSYGCSAGTSQRRRIPRVVASYCPSALYCERHNLCDDVLSLLDGICRLATHQINQMTSRVNVPSL